MIVKDRPEQQKYLHPKVILDHLVKDGLLGQVQAKQAIKDYPGALERLKRLETYKTASLRQTLVHPIDPIDVIVSLQLPRLDDPSNILDEDVIYASLSRAWGYKFYKPDPLKLSLDVVTGYIPYQFALRHLLLSISSEGASLKVATPYPFNLDAIHTLSKAIQLKIEVVVSPKKDVIRVINEFYNFRKYISAAEAQFGVQSVDISNLEQYVSVKSTDDDISNEQHIIKAVDFLLSYAIDQRASDIHLEPKREKVTVRLRIDGVLHTVYNLPKNIHPAIVNRIKNLSRMDMTEKRRPQDGRIKLAKEGLEVEIRVSSIPVAFGEKLVLRIQSPEVLFQDLEKLGMSPQDLMRYKQAISMPYGLILVCGPTGSGKTTTLYSTLRYLYSPEINISTIEDPVELVDETFNQIAVQPHIGVTFSNAIRHILRQDPDIIMVGEIRDKDTATNCIQAALTGHLVLSTLHTNDAPSAIIRLLDLGMESYLIKATLAASIAQRLVRKVCPHCKESHEMTGEELRGFGLEIEGEGTFRLFRGRGCTKCRGTGYLGRTGVFEVLLITEEIREHLHSSPDLKTLRELAKKQGMKSLKENAVNLLLQGITTYQEVLRVICQGT